MKTKWILALVLVLAAALILAGCTPTKPKDADVNGILTPTLNPEDAMNGEPGAQDPTLPALNQSGNNTEGGNGTGASGSNEGSGAAGSSQAASGNSSSSQTGTGNNSGTTGGNSAGSSNSGTAGSAGNTSTGNAGNSNTGNTGTDVGQDSDELPIMTEADTPAQSPAPANPQPTNPQPAQPTQPAETEAASEEEPTMPEWDGGDELPIIPIG